MFSCSDIKYINKGGSCLKTYNEVNALIKQWSIDGLDKASIVVNAANACIGWPYVFGGRGEMCTPNNRKSRVNPDYPSIVDKCQVLNGRSGSCSGCNYHPGDSVLFFDCRGFTYWLFRLVGIEIVGRGATTQYNTDSNWEEKGTIDKMPKDRVCCVFRYDKDSQKMEHTLLYDGNGNYIHCSGEVKKCKTSQYKATHYAIPKGMGKSKEKGGEKPMPEDEVTAVVYAENGKPVKMRAKPNTSCKTYWEIPCGTVVDVIKEDGEWTAIRYGTKEGYMMSQFLKTGDFKDEEPPAGTLTVIVPNLTKEQADEIVSKYPGAYTTVG